MMGEPWHAEEIRTTICKQRALLPRRAGYRARAVLEPARGAIYGRSEKKKKTVFRCSTLVVSTHRIHTFGSAQEGYTYGIKFHALTVTGSFRRVKDSV